MKAGKRGETGRSFREMWNLSFGDKVAKLVKCVLVFVFLHSSNMSVQNGLKQSWGWDCLTESGWSLNNTWSSLLDSMQRIPKKEIHLRSSTILKKRLKSSEWLSRKHLASSEFFQSCRSLLHSFKVSKSNKENAQGEKQFRKKQSSQKPVWYTYWRQKTEPAPLHSEALTLLSFLFEWKLCSLSEGENHNTHATAENHSIKSTYRDVLIFEYILLDTNWAATWELHS